MTDPLASNTVLTVLQQLISIPSVNPSLAADGSGEQAIAEFAAGWLNDHGVKAWVDEVAPGRFNAVGEVGSGTRTLAACAHIDTVQTTGMSIPPFEPRCDEGRVYGRNMEPLGYKPDQPRYLPQPERIPDFKTGCREQPDRR